MNLFKRITNVFTNELVAKDNTNDWQFIRDGNIDGGNMFAHAHDGFEHLRHSRPLRSKADQIIERKPRIFTPDASEPAPTPKSITGAYESYDADYDPYEEEKMLTECYFAEKYDHE